MTNSDRTIIRLEGGFSLVLFMYSWSFLFVYSSFFFSSQLHSMRPKRKTSGSTPVWIRPCMTSTSSDLLVPPLCCLRTSLTLSNIPLNIVTLGAASSLLLPLRRHYKGRLIPLLRANYFHLSKRFVFFLLVFGPNWWFILNKVFLANNFLFLFLGVCSTDMEKELVRILQHIPPDLFWSWPLIWWND